MKIPLLIVLAVFASVCTGEASVVYSNSFDSVANLSGFTVFGETFTTYHPPPLHTVSVDLGQLRIDTTYLQPNFPSSAPTLLGRATLMDDSSSFGNGYSPVLSQSSGKVSWSFNVSNQDGPFNNGFDFILASSALDPWAIGSVGYVLKGGGGVGNRMMLYRFSFGLGGGGSIIIDLSNGLATLPQKGSFQVTYEPQSELWSLYGSTGAAYVDPTGVNALLGSGIDSQHTHSSTPFFGFNGGTTGSDFFDNVSVAVVPEPSLGSAALVLSGLAFLHRRYRQ